MWNHEILDLQRIAALAKFAIRRPKYEGLNFWS